MLPFARHIPFYLGLAIGMATISEIVLLPGVYIGWLSGISLTSIFIFAVCVAAASDTLWYCIGRFFPKQRLMKYHLIRREKQRAQVLQEMYEKHKLRMTFYSKFMYGTQVFFQVMAGANRIPFLKYLGVSMLATIIWFLASALFGITVGWSIGEVKHTVIGIELALSATLLIGVISYLSICWFAKRKTSYRTR